MMHTVYISKEELLNHLNILSNNKTLTLVLKNKYITNWFICIKNTVRLISFNSSASTILVEDGFETISKICERHDYVESFYDTTENILEAIREYDRMNNTCSYFILKNLGGILNC